MSEKQDRNPVRTAMDLERKYQFGKQFAEVMGVALDAQHSISVLETSLRSEILEQVTSITRDTERILLTALESHVETEELEELKASFSAELEVMADMISMRFESNTNSTAAADGEIQQIKEYLEKYFEFSANGLTIKAGENSMGLFLDNDMIMFMQDGEQFGWWDGVNFYTGNIVVRVNERAQFGDFAFVPRSNGSLDFLKVGG